MNVKFIADYTRLDFLRTRQDIILSEALGETANFVVDHIKSNWSATAPSSVGDPPAIVSGNLDASVYAESAGRSGSGAFSKSGAIQSWFVQVDHPAAWALEFGYAPRNLAPRPYVMPALAAAESTLVNGITSSFRKTR